MIVQSKELNLLLTNKRIKIFKPAINTYLKQFKSMKSIKKHQY